MKSFISHSPNETKRFGQKLGRILQPGAVVALSGELGAGKTTLVKGIARGLGVQNEKEVSSPSFVLIHEYEGRFKVFHLDWYRLSAVKDADEALSEECFNGEAVSLVEWADRGKRLLPKERLEVLIKHAGPDTRMISLIPKGRRYENFVF